MRRIALALIAASSLLLGLAQAESRPRYGGTLRVALRAAPTSLDPTDAGLAGSLGGRNISSLIFDTLTTLDERGMPQPAIATSWQSEPGGQRWQFQLRSGVTFSDGSALSADAVAASLRVANPGWKVFAAADGIVIQRDSPAPDLLAELALTRNGIARRGSGRPLGTGAFVVSPWDPGKRLALSAREDYWAGRPFLDAIEIDCGKNFHDQMLALDLGKADVIEVAPEQAHRAAADGRRVQSSLPSELVALVFARDRQTADEGRLREALALSIDRDSLNTVLLQSAGEPSASLLPNWMTGYGFLFGAELDAAKARVARAEARQAWPWTLSYDAADPVARVMAERIALNARDTGLMLQPTTAAVADLRLVRIALASVDARVALTELCAALGIGPVGLPARSGTDSAEDLYAAESAALQSRRVIPLLLVRASYGMTASVENWKTASDGSWRLQDVWLSVQK